MYTLCAHARCGQNSGFGATKKKLITSEPDFGRWGKP